MATTYSMRRLVSLRPSCWASSPTRPASTAAPWACSPSAGRCWPPTWLPRTPSVAGGWTPLVAVALATLCCLGPVLGIGPGFREETDLGPGARAFYETFAGQASRPAREQLLADLGEAFARNALRAARKVLALRAALVILSVGLIVSAAFIVADQSRTIRVHDKQPHQSAA